MAVTGWKSAAVASDYNDGVGTYSWTKGTGAAISGSELSARDAVNSGSASILKSNTLKSGQRTFPLRARDFGFTTSDIPSGSTIDGIEIRIAVAGSGTGLTDNLIQLVMHSAGTAADRKGSNQASATPWANFAIPVPQRTYGGATDKWGSTLTDSDIRSSAFGMEIVAIRSTANSQPFADHVECRVYFTEEGGPGPARRSPRSHFWL